MEYEELVINSLLDYTEIDETVTYVRWNCGELDASVLELFPNLRELHYNNNKITSLEPVKNLINLVFLSCFATKIMSLEPVRNLVNLEELCCSNSEITSLEPIRNLVNLKSLSCSNNKITSLEPIRNLVNLKSLSCSSNKITSLEPIRNLINLKSLSCGNNKITSLEPIQNLINLKSLSCFNNQITSLGPIQNLINLNSLSCSNNIITSLEPIRNLINLNVLYCKNNQITSLNPIVNLRRLKLIEYDGNPLEPQSIQITRFLNSVRTNKSIYQDTQNIHDPHVQRSVTESVQKLLTDNKPENAIESMLASMLASSLSDHTKRRIVEYYQDTTIHSIQLITFGELFDYVWQRIVNSDHRNELIKILDEQIQDAECMCFTGRFNRTLSTLQGFYSDIEIKISSASQFTAIYDTLKIRFHGEELKNEMRKAYLERGYREEEFQSWIDAVEE